MGEPSTGWHHGSRRAGDQFSLEPSQATVGEKGLAIVAHAGRHVPLLLVMAEAGLLVAGLARRN